MPRSTLGQRSSSRTHPTQATNLGPGPRVSEFRLEMIQFSGVIRSLTKPSPSLPPSGGSKYEGGEE